MRCWARQDKAIGRREFIALIGGAAVTGPFAAYAQRPTMPVIGFLHAGSPGEQYATRLGAYQQGLKEAGYVEGQNVAVEYRWAEDQLDRLPDLAADLVRRQVAVIATPGSTPAALAAKAATSTIPIVFSAGADPVVLGLVPSLSRPGGNITGISAMNADLAAKRLGLMRTLLPTADRFFALINPKDPLTAPFIKDLQAGSAALGIHIDLLGADSEDEIDRVFAGLPRQPGRVLLVSTNIFFFNHRARIVALAAQYGVPAMYDDRGYTVSGGLISYGADFLDVMRQTGIYTGRVLKGERPADLPVIQESKFEMVINLKTARALGLDVPPPLLSVADDVIE